MITTKKLSQSIKIVFLLTVFLSVLTRPAAAGRLLQEYGEGERQFEEIEIGEGMVVCFHQRMLGEAVVEKDFIVYQFDKSTGELLERKSHWREDLPQSLPQLTINGELAGVMVKGEVQSATLYVISPESDVFPLEPCPDNPCWVVRSVVEGNLVVTIIDAVDGRYLGKGIPPPYTGFSLTGPIYFSPCDDAWTSWSQNAESWFIAMGYYTEHVVWPTQSRVMGHVQSWETAVFYELAHGGSTSFSSGCVGGTGAENTTAAEITAWIASYPKMPFVFIGSCDGMCITDINSLSHSFRKGSTENTVTVGYCGMSTTACETCWVYSIDWQDELFYRMSLGYAVKDAFDQANAAYPACALASCMRFAGDEDFAVVPVVGRGPCIITPEFIDFDMVAGGGYKDTTFLIINMDTATLVGDVSESCEYYSVASGGGPFSLAPGGSLLVTVRFAPTAGGTHDCTIETGSGICGDVQCTGQAPCMVEPDTLGFGTVLVGNFAILPFTITNHWDGPISGTVTESCDCYAILSGADYFLAPGQFQTVNVFFAPVSAGTHTCLIDAGYNFCKDLYCTGTGDAPAVCQVEPDSLHFGAVAVNDSVEKDFFITNTGGGVLSGTVSETCDYFDVVSGGGPYDLDPGDTAFVVVRFKPAAEGGQGCAVETGGGCIDVYCDGSGSAGTGIHDLVPGKIALFQNYPNPFNPVTTISFNLPEKARVNLSVFDLEGRLVKTLVDDTMDGGLKEAAWDGSDKRGNAVSSGVYFYRLKTGNQALTRKMVLLK